MKKTEQSFNSTLKRGGKSLKRTALRQRSLKEAKALKQYAAIRAQLLDMCGGKSELTGLYAKCYPIVLHHITGRENERLFNPFNVICVKTSEHEELHAHNTFEQKQKLLALVKKIRIAQGFKEADYGAARS